MEEKCAFYYFTPSRPREAGKLTDCNGVVQVHWTAPGYNLEYGYRFVQSSGKIFENVGS